MSRILDIIQVVDWLERYGPLLQFLDTETHGYGTLVLQMHGKRPVKVGRLGRMETLKMWEEDFEIRT